MINIAPIRTNIFGRMLSVRNGSPKLRYWKKLESTQFLPLIELQKIQWQRLLEMWSFLWRQNPFYRKRFIKYGLTENSLKNPEDIHKLPILTKKEVRKAADGMLSSGYKKSLLQHFKTGGSTGKALDIYITEACSELRNACAWRHDRWTGWEPGEPIGAAWGNPKLPRTVKEKLINKLIQPYIYFDTMAVTDNAVKRFAAEWKNIQPTLLFGHSHSLYILARMVRRLGIDHIRPVGIISTSMMLLPNERTFIEQVFHVPVTDRYGCEEVSLIGCECEHHDGMHMNIEHLIIEFIKEDGSIATAGEPGQIVVTDLMNKAMPFIRYKVEDIGVPLDRKCSCGRGLPLMKNVVGRVADFLVKKDGTRVAGVSLIENTLTKWPGIDQMQIIQETIDAIHIKIVPGGSYSDEVRFNLIDYFKRLFDADTHIQIEVINEIMPERSGKFRFSICKVDR
ncbi:putative adenylyltransferase [Desulfosarcina variabilis str. Montpellier]|uniref:phenylacetate--CoA ligase family protein n=1 Tax=Desulfosarcina variabilis TaxID=2300 RepID=UPI003AFA0811